MNFSCIFTLLNKNDHKKHSKQTSKRRNPPFFSYIKQILHEKSYENCSLEVKENFVTANERSIHKKAMTFSFSTLEASSLVLSFFYNFARCTFFKKSCFLVNLMKNSKYFLYINILNFFSEFGCIF